METIGFLFGCQTDESYSVTVSLTRREQTERRKKKKSHQTREMAVFFSLFFFSCKKIQPVKAQSLKQPFVASFSFCFKFHRFTCLLSDMFHRPSVCIVSSLLFFFSLFSFLLCLFIYYFSWYRTLKKKDEKNRVQNQSNTSPWVARRRQPASRHRYYQRIFVPAADCIFKFIQFFSSSSFVSLFYAAVLALHLL